MGEEKTMKLTHSIVLDPISTKGLTSSDVDQLTRDTREQMLNALTTMAQDAGSQAVRKQKKES